MKAALALWIRGGQEHLQHSQRVESDFNQLIGDIRSGKKPDYCIVHHP